MAIPVIMPKLEMSQETATVIEWLKQEGERVEKGEPLLTIETDKVTIDVESPAAGTLTGIAAGPDQVVPVTEVIAYILQPGEEGGEGGEGGEGRVTPVAQRMAAEYGVDLRTVSGTGIGGKITRADVEATVASLPPAPHEESVGVGLRTHPARVRATPAARRVARERGVDLAAVAGSGPRGRVQAADVLALAPAPTPALPQPWGREEADVEVVPLRGMRRTIAARMQRSYQTAPHITLTVEVDVSAAQALRSELNARAEALGAPRISVTAILVKVCAWALQRHRWVNASLHGEEIHLHKSSNVGVAVALEEGLIVPVIRNAEGLGIAEIASRLADLTARARQGILTPHDVSGGTFTISNLGMYGIDHFTAILNPPESAILAVGRMVKRSLVVEREGQDVAVIRPLMNMTLSVDHRVLDGAIAARFLRDVVDALEHPNLLLW